MSWNRLIGPAIILIAAAVAVAPQLAHGNSCGHDFDFHLVSWLDCLHSWRHGILYPHWAESANFHAGEPRFLFYPPLTWMLGAALGAVLPWKLVPIALTFLLLAGTGLATRALGRQFLDDGAATLAGCMALSSGYALFTAYERTAFGELTGGLWIPLLLLFALRELSRPSSKEPAKGGAPSVSLPIHSAKDAEWMGHPASSHSPDNGLFATSLFRRAFDGSAAPLALAIAGCWLSNAPLGVMGCYLLGAVALVLAFTSRSWAPLVRATVSVLLGIGLAAIYIVPAAYEQHWVNLRSAIDDPGERIESNWLFAHHADPSMADHDTVLLKASIIAVVMLAVALSGILICWLRCKLTAESRRWLPLALIPPAVLFLLLPVSLPLWNLLPELRFLQFPWRWLVALEAPMAIFFAAALWPARRWQRIGVALGCAVLFLTTVHFVSRDFFQACDDEDSVAGMLASYRSGAGFLGTDEYAPPRVNNIALASGLPDACLTGNAATVLGEPANGLEADETTSVWNAAQGSCEKVSNWQLDEPEHKRLVTVIRNSPKFLILRLRSYPAWRVAVNGSPLDSLPQRRDGLIVVPVWPGTIDLTVDWTTTPDVRAGRWISALALIALIGLAACENRPSGAKARLIMRHLRHD